MVAAIKNISVNWYQKIVNLVGGKVRAVQGDSGKEFHQPVERGNCPAVNNKRKRVKYLVYGTKKRLVNQQRQNNVGQKNELIKGVSKSGRAGELETVHNRDSISMMVRAGPDDKKSYEGRGAMGS
ncbi:hypothetical protein JOC37_001569 [Desulfohalotomaculum tongense]|uniref:hypothetical protein n=1 Tax=Desulforadius tongensis TaxID=1216062 RepID=UPI00195C6146|nr:hypothetical protein [Desulforadius tongensis]MBM7855184.1 hypothetical protein [Desulforadius tongensis]